MRVRNCVNSVMALWIIVSPWILRIPNTSQVVVSCLTGGIILLIVSLWGAIAAEWSLWGIVLSGACALWFIVQPFLGHFAAGGYFAIALPGLIALSMDFWTWMTHPVLLRPGSGTPS